MTGLRIFAVAACGALFGAALFAEPPAGKNWKLVWEDNFNYPDAELDKEWLSQNGPSGNVLSSRWRENAAVQDGILRLLAKKEKRGGQEWTTGNIWTKKTFKYGYFECRYKYAAASGLNNAFWLMPKPWQKLQEGAKLFEIDINEGHYPDIINVNLHNWGDSWKDDAGMRRHHATGKNILLSGGRAKADRTIIFDVPIETSKIRFTTDNYAYFHFRELRVFPKSPSGQYPDILKGNDTGGLENFAASAKIAASSPTYSKRPLDVPQKMIDGKTESAWVAEIGEGKFAEIDLGQKRAVGCIQFLTGWNDGGAKEYRKSLNSYKVEYWNGSEWIEASALNEERKTVEDLSKDYHLYSLLWDEKNIIYYFDGKEIFRLPNKICHSDAPVLLSLAVTHFAGKIGDDIDGKSMDVDYVKVWQEEGLEFVGELPQAPKK